MVGRRPQHAASKLACLSLSSARLYPSSIIPGHLSIAWLVFLVVFLVIWSPSRDRQGPSVLRPCTGPLNFSHIVDHFYDFFPLPVTDVDPSVLVCDVRC